MAGAGRDTNEAAAMCVVGRCLRKGQVEVMCVWCTHAAQRTQAVRACDAVCVCVCDATTCRAFVAPCACVTATIGA